MSNSYKTTCIACGGGNFYVTPHNGKGYCFNCGHFTQEGRIQLLKRAENIQGIRQFYSELTHYYHSCLTDEHRMYLHKRGVSDTHIETYKIGYVPQGWHTLYNDPVAFDAGMVIKDKGSFLSGRIVFPYYVNGVVTDMRGRLFVGKSDQKYLSPYGGSYYRGADYTFNHSALQYDQVVVTEGELKALASNEVGVPTVAIPGILSLRPQLKQRLGQSFTVCFDSQVEHWFDVVRAIQRLKKHFDNLLIATLPLMGRVKMDIDDYIKDFGADAYKRVISRAVPYNTWIRMVRV
jgi:DNA primase